VLEQAGQSKPVEVGALWSDPDGKGGYQGGHFFVNPAPATDAKLDSKDASSPIPAWLEPAMILPRREDLP
jgi:hypothetical protein